MYRAFELTSSVPLENNFLEKGRALRREGQEIVRKKLNSFALGGGSLDGSKIQEVWFPNLKADVFISHSHQDVEVALSLAGWLNETFGLQPFVDSCVWAYADDLLKRIDHDFCRINDERYDYNKRNESTSHVHMMLAAALQMMIDSAECTIFLNTNQSITTTEAIARTKSPWIYAELGFIELIRRREKEAHRGIIKEATTEFSARAARRLDVTYIAKRTPLTSITPGTLMNWQNGYQMLQNHHVRTHPLDKLYELAPDRSNSDNGEVLVHG